MFTSRNLPAQGRRLQAFTLLELSLALVILMLLVGVLYAIVDTTLRSSSELQERQNRNREINTFLSLCRKTFANLPATVNFEARVVPDGEKYDSELIFRNASGLWWWGDAKNASLSTILGVRGQVGGLVGIGILQDSEDNITSYLNGGAASRPWLMLLPDLRGAEWQFFDSTNLTWSKVWNNPSMRPAFAQLTLATPDGARDYIFRIPQVTVVPAMGAVQQ